MRIGGFDDGLTGLKPLLAKPTARRGFVGVRVLVTHRDWRDILILIEWKCQTPDCDGEEQPCLNQQVPQPAEPQGIDSNNQSATLVSARSVPPPCSDSPIR